jgi:hypothetical protein
VRSPEPLCPDNAVCLEGEPRENEMGLVAAITKGDDGFLLFALLGTTVLM